MTQIARSVSSCLRVLWNKEVRDLEKEPIMAFIYATLFLLSLPFLFFSDFQHFALSLVMSHLAFILKPSFSNRHVGHLCLLSCSAKQAVMQIHLPWERPLLTWMITSAREHFQPVQCSSGGLGSMWCCLGPCTSWQLSHHALWSQVQLVALLPCGNVLSSSGFRIAVVTSRFWLLPEILDVFGSNKLTEFFCCLLDGNQLILHFDHVRCDYFHLTLNVFTETGFICAWCGISISKLSGFEMGKLHVSFK